MCLLPDWFLCSLNIFRCSVQNKCYQCQLGPSQALVQIWMMFILACGQWLSCAVRSVFRMMYLHSSGGRIHRYSGVSPGEKKRTGVRKLYYIESEYRQSNIC